MTVTREDDKPWKTDLARKAAQRREMVGQELEEVIKKEKPDNVILASGGVPIVPCFCECAPGVVSA